MPKRRGGREGEGDERKGNVRGRGGRGGRKRREGESERRSFPHSSISLRCQQLAHSERSSCLEPLSVIPCKRPWQATHNVIAIVAEGISILHTRKLILRKLKKKNSPKFKNY